MAYWQLYYHFVWTTQDRQPYITAEIEPVLYRLLHAEAKAFYCPFFYSGGTPDHVHVVTAVRPTIAPADFMKQLKGSSSRLISREFKRTFVWQKGYGVFSLAADAIDPVKAYVLGQKQHHAANTLITDWEQTHDWNLGPEHEERAAEQTPVAEDTSRC